MITLRIITSSLLISFYSCASESAEHKSDPVAIELNNQAMTLVRFIGNPDSSKKAIALLDKATSIDSNYFLGHYNKLMFLSELRQLDKAVFTINKLIKLKPFAHDLYITGGFLYEKMQDTISSQKYFKKSLTICNQVLDTMSARNPDYLMLVINKAVSLTMLGSNLEKNMFLQNSSNILHENNRFDSITEKEIDYLYKNNKQALMEKFIPF